VCWWPVSAPAAQQQRQYEPRIPLPQPYADLPFALQGVLHGALRASNVLLTAQRRYQVADYALQELACSAGTSGRKSEVGTLLSGFCSVLHLRHHMVLTAALNMLTCSVSAMLVSWVDRDATVLACGGCCSRHTVQRPGT
jgi:hypothetical protein